MTTAAMPPDSDPKLDPDDDTLPPEHPAGADQPVSAGEVLSGEGPGGVGTGASSDGAPGADS